MSLRSKVWWRAIFGLTTLYLSGCNSATAPASLTDLVATAARAAALDSAFSAPALASFQSLGGQIHAAPPVVVGAARLLRVVRLPQAGTDRYAALANESRVLHEVVPSLASLAASAIFPDSLLGAVFTWNTTSQTYTHTGSGGPTNGIRFLLYAIDPLTGLPATPLNQIGYADVLDETVGGTARIHIQVKNTGNTITYLDYTFSGSGTSSSFTATVSGTITNGLAGSANKTLTFSTSITGSSSSITMSCSFTLNNPAVTIQETVTVADNGTTTTVTMDFSLTSTGETVAITGTVAVSDADGSTTVNLSFKVNGGSFATLTGSFSNPTLTRAGGGQFTTAERDAMALVFLAAADLGVKVGDLFQPAETILNL